MKSIYQTSAVGPFSPGEILHSCLENDLRSVLVCEEHLPEEAFDLSTGLLGDLLHQLSKYRIPLALVIREPRLHSEPFQAFLREINRGDQIRSFSTRNEAVRWLNSRTT